MGNKDALRLPVVSLGAEFLALGLLMRRNILAYKAPPNNAGYDLICIHPDPGKSEKVIKVQVKSRYQSDSDRAFPVKERSIAAFDYLMVIFLNIGNYYRRSEITPSFSEIEIYVLPSAWIQENIYKPISGFDKIRTKGHDLEEYKNDKGLELIAKRLGVGYPSRQQILGASAM